MKTRKASKVLAALTALAALPGCGDAPTMTIAAIPAPAPAPVVAAVAPAVVAAAPVAPPLADYDPATATATLVVKATLNGEAPKMRPLKFDADPKCMEQHKDPVNNQGVMAKDGKLANVIAYVSKGYEGKTYATPKDAFVLDQHGCMYQPHVFTLMVNQPISIKNSDPTMHNIHAMPEKGSEEFNQSQPAGAANLTQKFAKEEVAVKVKCDVHGWMEAWAGVFAHPFHAVTGEDGSTKIKLPPGEYEISVWHESTKLGKPASQKVTVAKDETKEITFVFEGKPK
jgi:hypothetical protein